MTIPREDLYDRIKRYWDADAPKAAFFDHANVLDDGVYRWAMHVNRPEFDQILLDNARRKGADVSLLLPAAAAVTP